MTACRCRRRASTRGPPPSRTPSAARAPRRGGAGHRRRPQPAADDEASAGAPEYLVDINDLHDTLSYIEEDRDVVRIGAMTRHREVLESELLRDLFPIFRDAERVIAGAMVVAALTMV